MRSSSLKTMLLLVILVLPVLACTSGRHTTRVKAPLRVEIDHGKIQGARYRLAKPKNWRKKILLVAPGWRPPDAPLVAELRTSDPFEFSLLEGGWLVATTSYRRTGMIIEDGIADLQNLVGRIEKYYGEADLLVIEGASMGASIGVLIAEGDYFPKRMKIGVLAYGVGLEEGGETGPLPLTHRPLKPVLFMSNRSEWDSPHDYVRETPWSDMRPVLWQVGRDGHVNLNSAERLLAVGAMQQWLEEGMRPGVDGLGGLDVTVDMSDRPTTADELPDGYSVRVINVDGVYGNIDTEMVDQDLDWMKEASPMGFYAKGHHQVFVRYGTTYADVGEGEFVAFLNAEGFVRIARNMGNAAGDIGCREGDALDLTSFIEIRKWDSMTPRCPEEKQNRSPMWKASGKE